VDSTKECFNSDVNFIISVVITELRFNMGIQH